MDIENGEDRNISSGLFIIFSVGLGTVYNQSKSEYLRDLKPWEEGQTKKNINPIIMGSRQELYTQLYIRKFSNNIINCRLISALRILLNAQHVSRVVMNETHFRLLIMTPCCIL